MKKMVCGDCGKVFDKEEADIRCENVGDFWGSPAYMETLICPFCRSDEIYDDGGEEDGF